ncbi:hypothetical protein ACO0LC_26060 [Undibacterium sp. JH2W]|uniref:hypothetical protein n=1 Tax=Undibacterium sp. JH2W TaxID=3413037 RepID=UPI003BF407A0
MNIRQSILCFCMLFAGMQSARAQEAQEIASVTDPVDEKAVSAQAERMLARTDLPAPPAVSEKLDASLGERGVSTPGKEGQGLYARVTKEYYSQSGYQNTKPEKTETLSKFGFRYSSTGNERIWLEYRFSEKGALRLRGAGHGGVKILAVWEY